MKVVAYPFVDEMSTPIGKIIIKATKEHICKVYFNDDEVLINPNTNKLTQNCKEQISYYFNGTLTIFDLPLLHEGTPFQQQVWQMLSNISYGKTISYLQLANQLGDANQVRAAANANGKNNIAIIVPCHRVIATDGKLTGYAWGLKRKQWLLDFEAKQSGSKLSLF